MTEQPTTPAPTIPASEAISPAPGTPATPEAQPSPTEASGVAQGAFDMAAWKAAGSNRTELPDSMRGLYDHLSDDFSKRDSFNAVKELRSMIDNADRQTQHRSGVYDKQEQPEGQPDRSRLGWLK